MAVREAHLKVRTQIGNSKNSESHTILTHHEKIYMTIIKSKKLKR
jgi:hypothetical protein